MTLGLSVVAVVLALIAMRPTPVAAAEGFMVCTGCTAEPGCALCSAQCINGWDHCVYACGGAGCPKT
jgi:hypothetical protein